MKYYNKVKKLTEQVVDIITYEYDGNYKGYTGANAVSLYLNAEHGINVNDSSIAYNAFCDALNNQ